MPFPTRRPSREERALAEDRLAALTAPAPWQPGEYEVLASAPAPVAEPALDELLQDPPAQRPLALPATLAGGRIDPGRAGALALACVAVAGAVLAGVVVLRARPHEVPLGPPVSVTTARPSATAGAGTVVVDVIGRVRRPGVVTLPVGSRVIDAVKAAGGLQPGASTTALNLARKLVDGEQVAVDVPGVTGAAMGGGAAGGLVNLNTATAADLEALDGVGPVLARRIVAWRDDNGGFTAVEQLQEISGIGERKYEAISGQVTV